MNTFTDPTGRPRPIRNLRPVLERSRNHAVDHITVTRQGSGAVFFLMWEDGATAKVEFASYGVALDFARNPRRAWAGCPVITQ